MAYSSAFKRRMIQRLEEPGAPPATQIAREAGVSISTLSRWKSQARVARHPADGEIMASKTLSNKRTPEDKLRIIMQAAALSDDELGAFLRKEGIHQAQLEQWRVEALGGLSASPPPARSLKKKGSSAADRKRIRQLEKELHRKEKALAESAALLMLQKKVQAIWGDGDGNT